MRRRLLVDGYNVIHADPDLKRLVQGDLELARARLVELLSEYARIRETDVVVVFDGHAGVSPHGSDEVVLGVRVIFSARGETADAVLESLALRADDPRLTTVATSDRATQEAVFSRGVMRMSARELVGAMREADADAAEAPVRWRAIVADRLDESAIARLRDLADSPGPGSADDTTDGGA